MAADFIKSHSRKTDELLFTIKTPKTTVQACHFSQCQPAADLSFQKKIKPSPMTAPNFCMLLQAFKQRQNYCITQPGLERILDFEIEHLNDLGDLCRKHLIAEFMGKHSNINCDDKQNILDSIKHISSQTSSVREVLPGRTYFIPQTMHKKDPLQTNDPNQKLFLQSRCRFQRRFTPAIPVSSPAVAEEICYEALLSSEKPANCLEENEQLHLYHIFRTAWNR